MTTPRKMTRGVTTGQLVLYNIHSHSHVAREFIATREMDGDGSRTQRAHLLSCLCLFLVDVVEREREVRLGWGGGV